MAKVKAFEVHGLELWFYSNDHRPAHFHVKRKGEWEIRVLILTTTSLELDCDHVWQKKSGPDAKLRKKLAKLVSNHREALLEEWDSAVDDEG